MLIYNSESFLVKYNQVQDTIMLDCLKKLHLNEFKEGMDEALLYATGHQIKRWVLNVEKIGNLEEEQESWLQYHLYPQLMGSLGADNFIAVVLSEKCYHALLVESGRLGLKSYNTFIKLNTFHAEEDALLWLSTEPLSSMIA